jgi:hypothetical protein
LCSTEITWAPSPSSRFASPNTSVVSPELNSRIRLGAISSNRCRRVATFGVVTTITPPDLTDPRWRAGPSTRLEVLRDLDQQDTIGGVDLGQAVHRATDLHLDSLAKVVVQPVDDVEAGEPRRPMLVANAPQDVTLPAADVKPSEPRQGVCGTDGCRMDLSEASPSDPCWTSAFTTRTTLIGRGQSPDRGGLCRPGGRLRRANATEG